jgi:hypothetical protein
MGFIFLTELKIFDLEEKTLWSNWDIVYEEANGIQWINGHKSKWSGLKLFPSGIENRKQHNVQIRPFQRNPIIYKTTEFLNFYKFLNFQILFV